MRRILSLSFVILLFILVSQKPALAYHHQILNEVLGVSTASALPQIDPTSEGPGLILPDSPFFFLDRFKQTVRIIFAFSPEEKARVHAQIAGERLAELRFMLAKNDVKAASVALQGVSDNLKGSADNVAKAEFEGKDVSKLATEINNNIKLKQQTLDNLEKDSTGTLKLVVERTQNDVFESKIKVDDSLPEDLLQNEVKSDLERRVRIKVNDASNSAKLLDRDLENLSKQAIEASQKSLTRRQEALKAAIGSKNEKLVEAQSKLLEAEKVRQQGLLTAQSKAAAQAKEALQKAQEAASKFQEAQKKVIEIREFKPQTFNNTSSVQGSSGGSGGGGSTETPKPVSGETETRGGGGH